MRLWIPAFAGMTAFMLFVSGCATAPAPAPVASVPVPAALPPVSRFAGMVRLPAQDVPLFEDDEDTATLHAAAEQSMAYYRSLPDKQLFVLANDTYTASDMADSMEFLSDTLANSRTSGEWLSVLKSSFTVYQSIGTDAERTVVFSSYYEPTISARSEKGPIYRFPLYARPPDLLDVDVSRFDATYQGMRVAGRKDGRALVPYYTRADIDGKKVLQKQNLEIAWAKDPMEVLDLQIEGSGWLDLGKGSNVRIRYDGDNGRRYRSVGQYLISTGRIPADKFSRTSFLKYMKRHPMDRQAMLNVNERYIFFRVDLSSAAPFALGNISVPLTAGRSIATDPKLFPRGGLAWINTERAMVKGEKVSGKTPLKRFMLNQDEGGAIQGPGRVDIFAGHGEDAKRLATHQWYKGKLYFLVRKS